jgi:hypothetical protein
LSRVELRRTLWRPKLVGSAWVRVHFTVAFSFTFTELCCTDSKTPADANETQEKTSLREFLSTKCKHFQRGKLTGVLYTSTWSWDAGDGWRRGRKEKVKPESIMEFLRY